MPRVIRLFMSAPRCGQREPAGAVDRPAGVEHHRGDQRQLQPVVEQQRRHPVGAEHLVRHHREQHRRGQHRADDHPAGQVGDLRPPLLRLGGLHLGRRPASRPIAARRTGPAAGRRLPQVRGSAVAPRWPGRRSACRGSCSSRRRTRTSPARPGSAAPSSAAYAGSAALSAKSGNTTREVQSPDSCRSKTSSTGTPWRTRMTSGLYPPRTVTSTRCTPPASSRRVGLARSEEEPAQPGDRGEPSPAAR